MEVALEDRTKIELYKVAEKLVGSAPFEMYIEPASNKGDNFQGEVIRVHFKKMNNNNDQNQSLILKMAPNNPIRREKVKVRNQFIREITMYNEVLSYFDDFQLSKGVNPKVDGFNEFPKCYSTINIDQFESLFLEDLRLRQFYMINMRQEELTFEHVSLLMKALGKFHAVSFALKDQQPNKFNELANQLCEEYWKMVEVCFKDGFQTMFEKLKTCLKNENRFDLVEKIERFAGEDIFKTIFSLTSNKLAEPYAVICHGDVTTNNSMFRKNESGKPIEVQIFDFQFSRCASPVTELVLYILCSTTKELRAKYYDQFLKIYHDSLSDLLMRLGSDPRKVFPYEALLEQCQKFGAYAIIVGTILVPMLWSDIDSMPNMDEVAVVESQNRKKMEENLFKIQSNEKQNAYNKSVTDMIDDIARFGYI